MKMGDYIESINKTKKNLIRGSSAAQQAEKLYPPFPILRSLSYHNDCILLVNELNARGLREFAVSNLMHYEFLLNVLEKRNRFSRWAKPQKDDKINLIMEAYNYSYSKAAEVSDILTDADVEELQKSMSKGGAGK